MPRWRSGDVGTRRAYHSAKLFGGGSARCRSGTGGAACVDTCAPVCLCSTRSDSSSVELPSKLRIREVEPGEWRERVRDGLVGAHVLVPFFRQARAHPYPRDVAARTTARTPAIGAAIHRALCAYSQQSSSCAPRITRRSLKRGASNHWARSRLYRSRSCERFMTRACSLATALSRSCERFMTRACSLATALSTTPRRIVHQRIQRSVRGSSSWTGWLVVSASGCSESV